MEIKHLSLEGLKLITPSLFHDARGLFFESFRDDFFTEQGIGPFVQENVSFSSKGVVRGLHFQRYPGQAKLVSCLEGEIWDVAVDLRVDSPTFMKWEAIVLSDQKPQMVFIPKGFAHGFCALSDAKVCYKVSSYYDPKEEMSLYWKDPDLQINWPIDNPILSEKDANAFQYKEICSALDFRQ